MGNNYCRLFLLIFLGLTGCLKGAEVGVSSSNSIFSGAVSAFNVDGDTIQIQWEKPSDWEPTAYIIYSVNNNNGQLTTIGTAPSTEVTFLNESLASGNRYSYVVRAVTDLGIIDSNTNVVSAFTYTGVTSSTVTGASTATLSFPSGGAADKIKIYCAENSSPFVVIDEISPTLTSYSLTGLTTGSTYTCKVKAKYTFKSESYEDSNVLTTMLTPQANPQESPFGFDGLASVQNINGSTVELNWTAAVPTSGKTIVGYNIFRREPDGTWSQFETTNTTFVMNDLQEGVEFGFIVRAVDSQSQTDGNSVLKTAFTYSGVSSFSIQSAQNITLTFPAATNAKSINVFCYQGVSTTAVISVNIPNSSSSYLLTTLTSGMSYTCNVKAVGTAGEDGNSASVIIRVP